MTLIPRPVRRTAVILPAALAAALLVTAAIPARAAGPQESETAPAFSAADLAGKSWSLAGLRDEGRTTVILFWSLRCAPCLREMAFLDELNGKYRDKGLLVLGVESARSTPAQIEEILEKLGNIELTPGYPIVPDPDGRLWDLFGVADVPTTFVINRRGTVISRFRDFSWEEKEKLRLLIEKEVLPRPSATPAAGSPPPVSRAAPPVPGAAPAEAPSILQEQKTLSEAPSKEEDFEKNRFFGDFYFNKEEYEKAQVHYLRCLELDPSVIYIRLKLGDLYARMKDFTKAREMWEGVLKIDPGNKEADDNIRRLIRGDY